MLDCPQKTRILVITPCIIPTFTNVSTVHCTLAQLVPFAVSQPNIGLLEPAPVLRSSSIADSENELLSYRLPWPVSKNSSIEHSHLQSAKQSDPVLQTLQYGGKQSVESCASEIEHGPSLIKVVTCDDTVSSQPPVSMSQENIVVGPGS